jgi:HSP20 family protein
VINAILNSIESAEEEIPTNDFVPAVNTRENDKSYVVELDLPGVKKDDIEITVEDNILTISGERKFKNESKDNDYYKTESVYGTFSRSFTLPEKVDSENISAEMTNGVLEVVIPKLPEEANKPKKIEIK